MKTWTVQGLEVKCHMPKPITESEVRVRLAGRDDVRLVRYSGTVSAKSLFRCVNGHEFSAWTRDIIRGTGCAICSGKARITEEELRRRLEGRADVELVEYGGAIMKKSLFRCPHGHEWWATAPHVDGGTGCARCSGKAIVSEDEVRERLAGRADVKLVEYSGRSKVPSLFRCPEGHECRATAYDVIRGIGCANCSSNGPRTEEEIRARLSDRQDVFLLAYAGTVTGGRCSGLQKGANGEPTVNNVARGCRTRRKGVQVDRASSRERGKPLMDSRRRSLRGFWS